ncbi:RRQRL motif-containing zinc-binding protein [Nocardia niigatensis]
MTTVDEAPDDSRQEYGWGLAPSHLKTRRQLREMGKSPGQSLVALMVGKVRGRRVVARLFDPDLAPAKRVPSDAQLAAIRKATHEHQLRAAERRGLSRTEMSAPAEPAPSWEQAPTPKEGNAMSDNKFEPVAEPVAAAGSAGASEQLEFDTPTGHGQRMAYLLATVAVNQARYRDQRLAKAVEEASVLGGEAIDELVTRSEQTQARAEARLEARPQHNPVATVEALADALVWHPNSAIATKHLNQITRDYAQQWGVLIDADDFSVAIDPEFDAQAAQDHAEADLLRQRESAIVDIVSAMPLLAATKAAVTAAVSRWSGEVDPADPGAGLLVTRREQLSVDLAEAKLPELDRARVEFVVDYLRGNTADVDLLYSPVIVDPGEEARGRVPRLLELFATNPKSAPLVGEEIKVMTPADQDRVRQAGKEIARGGEVDFKLWPDYVDRYELGEQIANYAAEADELATVADYLATGKFNAEERERLGAVTVVSARGTLTDDVNHQITRMTEQREQLRDTIGNSKGLAAVERAQLSAVLADIDTGRIRDHKQLPELLFADENTKSDADVNRVSGPADRLSTATREAITQRIEASGAAPQGRDAERLNSAVSSIGDSLYTVACGARSPGGIEYERKSYADKYAHLGRQLVKAGVGEAARAEIGQLLADRARQAGELGRTAAWREQQWKAKVDSAVAHRNDSLAQRQAAAAGRAPHTGRARAPRAEKTATEAHAQAQAQAQQSRATAGRRQLHSPEVER